MSQYKKRTLIAGLTTILAVNIFVLTGVFYNRSGTPESTLRLSERELNEPYVWGNRAENSGLSLKLVWRVLPTEPTNPTNPTDSEKNSKPADQYWRYANYQGGTNWLNEAKMIALGFDSVADQLPADGGSRVARQLPRDVLLVLELDGSAYQAALAQAVKYNRGTEEDLKLLADEQTNNSRLFVIDAGLTSDASATALRTRYADRSRYAIVQGQIHPAWWLAAGVNKISGTVSKINVDNLHVPLEMRAALDSKFAGAVASYEQSVKTKRVRYEAVVAFGQRLEPWITAATRK